MGVLPTKSRFHLPPPSRRPLAEPSSAAKKQLVRKQAAPLQLPSFLPPFGEQKLY